MVNRILMQLGKISDQNFIYKINIFVYLERKEIRVKIKKLSMFLDVIFFRT